MPTYDYQCESCGHAFEKFQSITAPAVRRCPVCGELKVKRLIGPGAGIIFRGSGFYATDYRSEDYKNSAKADKEGTKTSSSDDGKSTDKSTGSTESTKSDSSSQGD